MKSRYILGGGDEIEPLHPLERKKVFAAVKSVAEITEGN